MRREEGKRTFKQVYDWRGILRSFDRDFHLRRRNLKVSNSRSHSGRATLGIRLFLLDRRHSARARARARETAEGKERL